MLHSRHRWLLLVPLLAVGALAATGGYALRLNSSAYRGALERDLAKFLRLPCEIGSIRPLTFSSRAFHDVTIWLADRRAKVFSCNRAVWHEHRGSPDELDVYDGTLAVATDQWRRDDYSRVLESGLSHDPQSMDLSVVRLHDFAVRLAHRDLHLTFARADGAVTFESGSGTARLTASEINGHATAAPIEVAARFDPRARAPVQSVELRLPDVALADAGLDGLFGGRPPRGRFAGTVQWSGPAGRSNVVISGTLRDAALTELSASLGSGPLHGELDVTVERAHLVDRVLVELAGHGEIRALQLADVGRLIGRPDLAGVANLHVNGLDAAAGRLRSLAFDGAIDDVPIEALTAPLGSGQATGRLRGRVRAWHVRDDVIQWGDAQIDALPPPGRSAGTVDRELLLSGLARVLPVQLPAALGRSFLPSKIEYVRFGVRLRVTDNRLSLLGTHGSNGDTILTIHALGRDWAIVRSLPFEIDLTPHLARLRAALNQRPPRPVPQWWRPAPGPAASPRPAPAGQAPLPPPAR